MPSHASALRVQKASATGANPLDAPDSVEAMISAVAARGLRINNLFQLGDGWRANLTDGALFYEFGNGPTPAKALEAALQRAGLDR